MYFIFLVVICIGIYVDLSSLRSRNIIMSCIIIFISLIIGYKYQVGVDWIAYERWYNTVSLSFSEINTEIGFKYLILLAYHTGLDYYTFNFIVTLIALIVFSRFWKINLGYVAIPFVFIFFKGYSALLLEQTRQLLAFSISFIAISSLLRKKTICFFIFMMFAVTFHSSAAILFICYFLPKIKINNTWFIAVYGICFFGGVIHVDLLSVIPVLIYKLNLTDLHAMSKLVRYMSQDGYQFFTLGVFERLFLFLFFVVSYCKSRYLIDLNYRFHYNLGVIYFLFAICTFNYPVVLARFSPYFFIGVIYILCIYMERFSKHKIAAISVVYIFVMSAHFSRNTEYIEIIYPYRNYLIDGVIYGEWNVNRENAEKYWIKRGFIID